MAIAALAVLALAGPASAAVGWTLVGGPLTATVFQSTTYTFTATNLIYGNDIGCVEIQLPDSYVINGLGTPAASNGDDWTAELWGGTNWVLVHSESGGGRLEIGEWVTFSVTATATQVGAQIWNNHAHRAQDCNDGVELEPGVMPMVVAPVLVPTPVPSVLPPTPVPTPRPTPTAPPGATPTPQPTATPRPSETASPTPSGTPRPTPDGVVAFPGSGLGGPAGPGAPAPVGRMAPLEDSQTSPIGLGTEVFALLEGPLMWFVPGAVVGGPGLLIVLFLALQAGGALAWIPAVRKMSGDPIPVQRRRRPGN